MEKHFIDGFPKSTFEENTSNRNTIKHALRNETSLLRVCQIVFLLKIYIFRRNLFFKSVSKIITYQTFSRKHYQ